MMPLAWHDTDAGANGITWPKSPPASPFDHLDITNGMVPLMTLLASCDRDMSINGIAWSKKLCCTLFHSSWPNKQNDAIDSALVICDAHIGSNSIAWTKETYQTLFQLSDLMNKRMPLMMQSASHGSSAGTNGIACLKIIFLLILLIIT